MAHPAQPRQPKPAQLARRHVRRATLPSPGSNGLQ
jgi:hypothetical protein